MANFLRLEPYTYIHVQDTNSNVTRLEIGPQLYIRQENEKIVSGKTPKDMVSIPPRHYVSIKNPVQMDEDRHPVYDRYGTVNVRHGEIEIRFSEDYPEPFALYPGESLEADITPLLVVPKNSALLIEAERFFTDKDGNERQPGDMWYFFGLGTYYPRVEERIVRKVNSQYIKENQALLLRAQRELTDFTGQLRKAGEEWLVRVPGAYLQGVYEEVVDLYNAEILNEFVALHLRATKTFTDVYGNERKAGEEWLVTSRMSTTHIIDVYEVKVGVVNRTILTKHQYCIVVDPVDPSTGKNQYGARQLRAGEDAFFIMPGEALEGGIKDVYILGDDEGLLLRAKEAVTIEGQAKNPGDRWMIYGPCSYIPPIEVEVLSKRKEIPLHLNEGIYVRDIKSGQVKAVIGKTHMLNANEELWEMPLSDIVEGILVKSNQGRKNKTDVVKYKVPANSVVQIYNYKTQQNRCIVGPSLVMLEPDESFTLNVLSGQTPKTAGVIKTIHIMLGPDFSTDLIEVDTADHARLELRLSYNWRFVVDSSDQSSMSKVFNVRDFVGSMCTDLAARVRSAVAAASFDEFHRESARIIRRSIFGLNAEGKIRDELLFPENNLVVTNVDIQGIEPVDKRTKDSLARSVMLAIEISSRTQEANARHQAEQQAQEAEGHLQRQKIEDQSLVEEENINLIKLKGDCEAVITEGKATANAKAKAEAAKILGSVAVQAAELENKAQQLRQDIEIQYIREKQSEEIQYLSSTNQIEIEKARALAEIEAKKFEDTIGSIGPETLIAISEAGPQLQAELLEGLGLSGYLMMDADNPVNLFSTAQGLIGNSFGGAPVNFNEQSSQSQVYGRF